MYTKNTLEGYLIVNKVFNMLKTLLGESINEKLQISLYRRL
jgi:hypothetical protein